MSYWLLQLSLLAVSVATQETVHREELIELQTSVRQLQREVAEQNALRQHTLRRPMFTVTVAYYVDNESSLLCT